MIDDCYVLCFQSQKGGVGKTTLACHFARSMIWFGQPVILIDTDPQGSAQDWMAARETESPFPVVGFTRDTLHKDIRQVVQGYRFAIIDSPPRTTNVVRSAMAVSDAVVIPVTPSALDVWAMDDTFRIANEAKTYNENLRVGIAVNREIGNTQLSRTVEKELQKTGIQVFQNHIKQRVAYAEVMGIGKTVMEVDPEGTASVEFSNLFLEVLGWTGCVVDFSPKKKDIYAAAKDVINTSEELIKIHEKRGEVADRLLEGKDKELKGRDKVLEAAERHIKKQDEMIRDQAELLAEYRAMTRRIEGS